MTKEKKIIKPSVEPKDKSKKPATPKKESPSKNNTLLATAWKKFAELKLSYKAVIILILIGVIARIFEKL